MEMNINEIVSGINNVNFFQFRWANQRDSAGRLERVLGEFLGQMEIDSEIIYNPKEIDNSHIALRLTTAEDEGDHVVSPHMWLLEGTGIMSIYADYTTVRFLPNGVCIIDQRSQSEHWHNGDGGFFATQPGTAFARVLAHGFVPEPVAEYDIYQFVEGAEYLDIREFRYSREEENNVNDIILVDNGAIIIRDTTEEIPVVYSV